MLKITNFNTIYLKKFRIFSIFCSWKSWKSVITVNEIPGYFTDFLVIENWSCQRDFGILAHFANENHARVWAQTRNSNMPLTEPHFFILSAHTCKASHEIFFNQFIIIIIVSWPISSRYAFKLCGCSLCTAGFIYSVECQMLLFDDNGEFSGLICPTSR